MFCKYHILYARRFAPRAAYAARYDCSGRKSSVKRTKVHDWLQVQTGRLENAKSPAVMLQENNPDATRMSMPRMYLVSCCICYIYVWTVSKLVTAELLSLGWRIGTDTGCAGLVLAGCRWVGKTVLKYTASTSVEQMVEVTAKRRLL